MRVTVVSRTGQDGGLRSARNDDEVELERRISNIALERRLDAVRISRCRSWSPRHPQLRGAGQRHRPRDSQSCLRERSADSQPTWSGSETVRCATLRSSATDNLGSPRRHRRIWFGGPLDPVKIGMAGRIAEAEEATIRLVHVLADHASGRQVHSLRTYHAALDGVTPVRTYSDISQNEALVQELAERSRNADLVVMGALRSRFRLLTDLVDRIREQVDAPVLLVRTHELARRPSLAGRILERLLR